MADRDYELLTEYLGKEKLGELEVSIFNGLFEGLDDIVKRNKRFSEILEQTPGLREELHLLYRKSYFRQMVFQIANYARINNLSQLEVSTNLVDFEIPTAGDIYADVCEDQKNPLSKHIRSSEPVRGFFG